MFMQKYSDEKPMPEMTRSSLREHARSAVLTKSRNTRTFFSMANTFFLVFLSFFGGYNLKAYQVRENFNRRIAISNEYIDEIKKNHAASEEILRQLNTRVQTHFEASIHPPLSIRPKAKQEEVELLGKTEDSDTLRAAPVPVHETVSIDPVPVSVPTVNVPQPQPVRGIYTPKQAFQVPFDHVRYTIQDGDVLSALVPRRSMNLFLKENPSISDPDQIYTGQDILIPVPRSNILMGIYMNRYFVRPCPPGPGGCSHMLQEWLTIPENRTSLGFLIHENSPRVKRSTIPFMDFSREANRIKDNLWSSDMGHRNMTSRVRHILAGHGPILFQTDVLTDPGHPSFYRGVRESGYAKLRDHNQAVLKDMNRLFSGMIQGKPGQGMYHFMIFGDTVVQSSFLTGDHFQDMSDKPRILIGIIHSNTSTAQALNTLKRAIGVCRVHPGDMAEVDTNNLSFFLD